MRLQFLFRAAAINRGERVEDRAANAGPARRKDTMIGRVVASIPLFALLVAFSAGSVAVGCRQHPPVRVLDEQELMDMMVGSSIQASRANNTAGAIERLRRALAAGKRFTLISVEDLPDDWTVVAPANVGGGGAWEHVIERATEQSLPWVRNTMLQAAQTLSRHMGKRFNAVIRVESAGVTLSALELAAALGVPLVDGCLSGRARPEIQQQIPWINDIPSTPAALVTRWGDRVIIDRAVDDYRSDDLARAVAVASGGGASIAMNPMSGADVKRGVIRGAVTEAILYGRTVREAVAKGQDAVQALVEVSHGYKLFQGIVAKAESRGERGFSWWDVELTGTGEYAGHTYRIYVKNENIVTWLDGVPDAMSPDYISNLDPPTGDAHYPGPGRAGGYALGAEVAMVGIPASPMWRTPRGLEVFGPRYFGFDFDYVPIEELYERRKPKG